MAMAQEKSAAEKEAERDGWNGHKAGRPIHDRPNYPTDREREAHASGWRSRVAAVALGVEDEPDASKMPWKRIGLTSDQLAAGVEGEIQDQCASLWRVFRCPESALLLSSSGQPGRGPYFIYFSPRMAEISSAIMAPYSLEDCLKPNWGDVGVLLSSGDPATSFKAA